MIASVMEQTKIKNIYTSTIYPITYHHQNQIHQTLILFCPFSFLEIPSSPLVVYMTAKL